VEQEPLTLQVISEDRVAQIEYIFIILREIYLSNSKRQKSA
jgi:hypothetical protein